MTNLFGIYIHWPFCKSKCPYCDFNSHVSNTIDHDAWLEAYLKELEHHAILTQGRTVYSVFFGGGTPSLMRPDVVEKIIDKIHALWPMVNDPEITLEANPTSIEAQKFTRFKSAGINRVSVGVQSLRDKDLAFFGREHSAQEALNALQIAKNTFARTSFDLIYARPDQSLKDWEEELREAIKYTQGHLSVYQLTIEPNTAFFTQHARGDFAIPQDDLAADFYDLTQDILEAHNLPAYEISNHAAPEQESRHNLVYWRYGDYAGIGPGAHGRLTLNGMKYATRGHRAPDIWLQNVRETSSGLHPMEDITPEQQVQESLMMGLRLKDGIDISEYGGAIEESKIQTLCLENLVVLDGHILKTTREGAKKLNSVLAYLLV